MARKMTKLPTFQASAGPRSPKANSSYAYNPIDGSSTEDDVLGEDSARASAKEEESGSARESAKAEESCSARESAKEEESCSAQSAKEEDSCNGSHSELGRRNSVDAASSDGRSSHEQREDGGANPEPLVASSVAADVLMDTGDLRPRSERGDEGDINNGSDSSAMAAVEEPAERNPRHERSHSESSAISHNYRSEGGSVRGSDVGSSDRSPGKESAAARGVESPVSVASSTSVRRNFPELSRLTT